jgi:hypothetical protein
MAELNSKHITRADNPNAFSRPEHNIGFTEKKANDRGIVSLIYLY